MAWSLDTLHQSGDFADILLPLLKKHPRVSFSDKEKSDMAHKQGWRCAIGGRSFEKSDIGRTIEVEHLLPIAKGGDNEYSNLRLVDSQINNLKGTMSVFGTPIISKAARPAEWDKRKASLLPGQVHYRLYEEKDDIHYMVIPHDDIDAWHHIRRKTGQKHNNV